MDSKGKDSDNILIDDTDWEDIDLKYTDWENIYLQDIQLYDTQKYLNLKNIKNILYKHVSLMVK